MNASSMAALVLLLVGSCTLCLCKRRIAADEVVNAIVVGEKSFATADTHADSSSLSEYNRTSLSSQPTPRHIQKANEGYGARTASQCLVAQNCKECAQIVSSFGSCRWCGGNCIGYEAFSAAMKKFKESPALGCDAGAAIYDKPALCDACSNNFAKSWREVNAFPKTTVVTCSQVATLQKCGTGRIAQLCKKACAIYSRTIPFGSCMVPARVTSNLVQQIKDANPQPYDVLFVTEGGNLTTNAIHAVIRVTAGGSFSHALIISQVKPKLMVLESVSNVEETLGQKEPNGVREVALEYAFAHVTKFALVRKRTACQKRGGPHNAITWARHRINIPQKPTPKPYASFQSFASIGFTMSRANGYNDKPGNEPDKYYCSQLVAYMLYKRGCAFESSTNLNVDPVEMFNALLAKEDDYYIVTRSSP